MWLLSLNFSTRQLMSPFVLFWGDEEGNRGRNEHLACEHSQGTFASWYYPDDDDYYYHGDREVSTIKKKYNKVVQWTSQ